MYNTIDIEQHRQEFNQRFANLIHTHRGECTIQDSEGRYPMTTTVGKVVHGLDAVREYHLTKLTEVAEEAKNKERDKIYKDLQSLFMGAKSFEDRTEQLHTYLNMLASNH